MDSQRSRRALSGEDPDSDSKVLAEAEEAVRVRLVGERAGAPPAS